MNKNESLSFKEEEGVLCAVIENDIDHHAAKYLREAIDEVLYIKRPRIFYLDLSSVTFMDSSGLGLILGRFTLCRELGIEFSLLSPSREVKKILALAGSERIIKISEAAQMQGRKE